MRHGAIPGLFLNGEDNFTIEVFFYLKNKESRSILYGQQGKFELGIDNGQIFLNAPGFCSFIVAEATVTLEPENFYYIAVTYDGSKISLFLLGYKIFEAEKTGVSARSEDPLSIGMGALGYICTIRVFSEVLSGSQILSNNLNELTGRDSCEAWLVFSDIQPIDKGKNKLAISLVGEGAKVVNLVACSSFSGMGCALLKNKVNENYEAFTVLGKAYPLFTSNSEMAIFTSRSAADGYTVLLRRQENYNYKLVFKTTGAELTSSKDIEANRWFDFAVTLSSGKITLFIDGAQAGEMNVASINLKGDANALIGTGYDDGYVGFKQGFSGYIDYIAEFEKALDSTRIGGYVDNPPFIFDKDLISSMSLNSATPSELAYDEPIWGHGDFRYGLAESTNPTNSPKGIQYFYPTEKDPRWDTLSLEDQWKLNYYCTYVDTIINGVLGLAQQHNGNMVGVDPDLARTGTTGLLRRRVNARVNLNPPNQRNLEIEMQPLLRRRGNVQNRRAPRIPGNGFNGAVGGGVAAMGAGATGSACGSGTFMMAVGAVVIVAASAFLIPIFYNRPEPTKSDIRIKSLQFNSDGDSTIGSLNCRKNSTKTVPVKAVKNPSNGKIEITGVFVPSDLTKITLTVEVYCEGKSSLSGRIKATETPSIIGDLISDEFTINSGKPKYISIDIGAAKLKEASQGMVKNFAANWNWTFVRGTDETFLINSSQTIYTVIARPLSPWICTKQSYKNGEIGYIWTDLLDVCFSAYKSYSDPKSCLPVDLEHVRAYTLELNKNTAFKYDKISGASKYVTDFDTIKLQKCLNDRISTSTNDLNCTDCANIVAIEAAASGIDVTMGIMALNFKCNQIKAIGYTNWEVPFPPRGGFSYHQVAIIGHAGRSKESKIFDACLKLDAGSYPGKLESSTYTKTPRLPINNTFSETGNLQVNVPVSTPYDKPFYRERLVGDKSKCEFLPSPIPVANISKTITIASGAVNMEEDAYQEYFNMVKKRFGLEENPLPKKRGISAANVFTDIKKIAGVTQSELEEDYGEQKVYSAVRDGNNYRVDINKAADEQMAYSVLTRRLAFVTNPALQRRNDLGDIAFAIDDSYIITVRNNVVITVSGKDAVQLAKDLIKQL